MKITKQWLQKRGEQNVVIVELEDERGFPSEPVFGRQIGQFFVNINYPIGQQGRTQETKGSVEITSLRPERNNDKAMWKQGLRLTMPVSDGMNSGGRYWPIEEMEYFDLSFDLDTIPTGPTPEELAGGKKEPDQPTIIPKPPTIDPNKPDVKPIDVTKAPETGGGGFAIPGIGAFAGGKWYLIKQPELAEKANVGDLANLVGVLVNRSNEQSKVVSELLIKLKDLL